MNIQKNIPLKDYTTFKIGGPAKYFVEINTIEELQEILKWNKEKKQPILILGSGSNLIISDKGFNGLVLKLNLNKLEFNNTQVKVGSGIILAYLINKSLDNGLVGLEFATGIPGTVGGAILGNVGTYGVDMSSVVKNIRYLNEHHKLRSRDTKRAEFGYRHSIFKKRNCIILEVDLELKKGNVAEARELVKARLAYRQDTQPNEPSAGCIFKNILFDEVDLEDLRNQGLNLDNFIKYRKIPAGFLIEQAGLKGQTMGEAQISHKHANYIINKGEATAEQVIMLISFIKQQIRDKYGIQLQEEVQIIV